MVNFNRRFAGLAPLPVDVDVERAEWVGTDRATALYPMGWGQLSNTPFPSYKTYTGGGGRRVSFIVSWPAELGDKGAIRGQFGHVTDIMPTLLELAGVAPLDVSHGKPAQPMQGHSLAGVLRDGTAVSPRREQYYECWANRAYFRDGWVAVSLQVKGQSIDFDNWTLHNQADDFSEGVDVARQHPELLRELVEAFDEAAWANMVYPLDGRSPLQKFNELAPHQRPPATARRRFLPGTQTIHRGVIVPLIADRSFTITADFTQTPGATGVLFAIGDVTGGMIAYIEDARLRLYYNGFGEFHELTGPGIGNGRHRAVLEFEALGKRRGRGRLNVDGQAGEWGDLSPTMMYGFHEGLDIGIDRRGPVKWELKEKYGSFRYGGTIHEVVVETGPFAPDTGYAKG
jgi:arylsulfatase